MCEGYTDVIGFHRAGVGAGRRHLRHGPHRGARAAAEALRQPRRAGLRRRRRRPRRGRAVLRVGAGVRAVGRAWPGCRPASTPATWPNRDPAALAAAVDGALPFLGFRVDRVIGAAPARPRTRPGRRPPRRPSPSSTSIRTSWCVASTRPRWPCGAGSRPMTCVAMAAQQTRRPRITVVAAPGTSRGHAGDDGAGGRPRRLGRRSPVAARGAVRRPHPPGRVPRPRPGRRAARRRARAWPSRRRPSCCSGWPWRSRPTTRPRRCSTSSAPAAMREVVALKAAGDAAAVRDVRLLEQRLDDPEAGPDAAAQLLGWLETRLGEHV